MKFIPLFLLVLCSAGYVNAADAPAPHAGFHMEASALMEKMGAEMKTMKATGNADKDFAAMMISHHQGAVEMSEAYLKFGKDDELKKMASKMIEDQKKEIQMMKAKL